MSGLWSNAVCGLSALLHRYRLLYYNLATSNRDKRHIVVFRFDSIDGEVRMGAQGDGG